MGDEKLLQYYIEATNDRLQKIEGKLDQLISFRIMLLGAAMGVSTLVSILFQIFLVIWKN